MAKFQSELGGRKIWFERPNLSQMALLHRLADASQAAQGTDDYLRLVRETIEATFDIIESMIIDDADRKFVLKAILRGQIEHSDTMAILAGGEGESQDEDAPEDE